MPARTHGAFLAPQAGTSVDLRTQIASNSAIVKTPIPKVGGEASRSERDWHLQMGLARRDGHFLGYPPIGSEVHCLVFFTEYPLNARPDRRTAVAELVARINVGLAFGNFDLDMDDGEIHCRTGFMLEGDHLDAGLLRHTVFANWLSTNMYFPAFAAVLYQGMLPKEAVELAKDNLKNSGRKSNSSPSPRFGGRLGELLGGSGN